MEGPVTQAFAEKLAQAYEEKAAKVSESVGTVEGALLAAAVWEGAARWARKLALGEDLPI